MTEPISKDKNNISVWKMINFIHPKHSSSFKPKICCSDDEPFNWGNFGCARCDLIIFIEKKKNITLVDENGRI